MVDEAQSVLERLAELNAAWLAGRPRDMAPWLREDLVHVLPGFSGRAVGREAFIASFEDFGSAGTVDAFEATGHACDVSGAVAVASFTFAMRYTVAAGTFDCTGRDVWAFARDPDGEWRVAWRSMLDVEERPAEPAS